MANDAESLNLDWLFLSGPTSRRLLDLNVDCLCGIFNRLPAVDLISIAETCRHFYNIARIAVPKTFTISTVHESHRQNSTYILQKYFQYFGDSIHHISYDYEPNRSQILCHTFDTRANSFDPSLDNIIEHCGGTLQSIELTANYPFVKTSDEFLKTGGLFVRLKELKIIGLVPNSAPIFNFEAKIECFFEGRNKSSICKQIMCALDNYDENMNYLLNEMSELIIGHFGLSRMRVTVPDFEPLTIKRNGENTYFDRHNYRKTRHYLHQYLRHLRLIFPLFCDRQESVHTLIANSAFTLETVDLQAVAMHNFRVVDALQHCQHLRVLKLNESTQSCLYGAHSCSCYTAERLNILQNLTGLQEIELNSNSAFGKMCIFQFIYNFGCTDTLQVLRILDDVEDKELFESISRFHRLRVLKFGCSRTNRSRHLALLGNLTELEEIGLYELDQQMPIELIDVLETVKLLPKIKVFKMLYAPDVVHSMTAYRNLVQLCRQQHRSLSIIYCNRTGVPEKDLEDSLPKSCDSIKFCVKPVKGFWNDEIEIS